LSATLLVACSKTVRWEEEVPLNTGETIWVTRTVVYSLQGEGGNPMNIGYRQNRTETLSFSWSGKNYSYEGDAALMLLAISPAHKPVLVAPASDRSWAWRHGYYCANPHYVQFSPDADGRKWTWPPQIEPWLYGMQHNLMRQRHSHGEMLTRYTAAQRGEEDRLLSIQTPSRVVIDPTLTENNCKKRN
jgi:hypothetical protein